MTSVRWLDEHERAAWRNLTLMQLQLTAFLGRGLADDGLSYQDYVVIAELSDRPDERARMSDLARQLGWEKSRLSHHVARMEQRGLVEKVRCPTDLRGWFVGLSATGRDTIAAAAPGHVATVREQFIDLLSAEQLATLDEIARTVLAHLPGDGDR